MSNESKKVFYCWLKVGLIFVILLISSAHAGSAQELPSFPVRPPPLIVFYKVTVTPTPSTIYPTTLTSSSYSEIKVTVTNNSGSPISGVTLNLTSTGGDIQNKLGNTKNDGTFTTRFSSSNSGTFFVNVTASTGGSNLSIYRGFASIQITVLNNDPTAKFSVSSRTGEVPLTIIFDASGSTDIDGTITSYSWNFGDGKNGIGKIANHTYENNGEYIPSLTVTDNLGQSNSVIDKIIVSPMPALSLAITSEPASIESGKTSTIKVTVTGKNSAPISGANVMLASAAGGIINPVSGITDSNGQFTSIFTVTVSSEGTFSIKGKATKDNFIDGLGETQVAATIKPAISIPATTLPTETAATLFPTETASGNGNNGKVLQWDAILIFILVIAVPVAILLFKRKNGKSKEEQQIEKWEKEGYDVSGLKEELEGKK